MKIKIKEAMKKAKENAIKVKDRVVDTVKDNKEVFAAAGILGGIGLTGIFAIKKGSQMIEDEAQKIAEQMNDEMVEDTVTTESGETIHGQWLDLGDEGKMFFADNIPEEKED